MLVIADEVITGFGRTGTMFACERFGIDPDMHGAVEADHLVLPAAVGDPVLSDAIYQAIADNSAEDRRPSATASPPAAIRWRPRWRSKI